MYLSPCLIAVIVIIIYIVSGKQNQVKIKNFINKNQKILIGLLILGGIYYFMNVEGMDHEDEHSDDADADTDADADADADADTENPDATAEQEPEGVSEKECLLYWPF
jgi:hypothetical protein